MPYLFALIAAVVSCVAFCAFVQGLLASRSVPSADTPPLVGTLADGREADCPKSKGLSRKQLILLLLFVFLATFGLAWLNAERASNWINAIKLSWVFALLLPAAWIDWKQRIIPNRLVLTGLVVRLLLYIPEIFLFRADFKGIVLTDLLGVAMGFGVLMLTTIISRGGIGFGDIKLFGFIGLTVGFNATFSTLFAACATSAVVGIGLMVAKKKKGKDSLPFGPFILLGYIATLLLGTY